MSLVYDCDHGESDVQPILEVEEDGEDNFPLVLRSDSALPRNLNYDCYSLSATKP